MNECCRNERSASVLQGRSISTIHLSLITTAELRRNLFLSFLLSFTISPSSFYCFSGSPFVFSLHLFPLLLNLSVCRSLYFFHLKIFNGMKANKTYVSQAHLHGSLGTDQYFLIAVSPFLYQCPSSVFICKAKIFLSPSLLSLLPFPSMHIIYEPRT